MAVDLAPDPAVAELATRTAAFVRRTVLPVEQECGESCVPSPYAPTCKQRRRRLLELLFDVTIVGMSTLARPETIADAASRLAAMDDLPRTIRLAAAHVLREAAAGLRRGQPLPTRLHRAVGEFVSAIEASTGRDEGDEVEFP